MPRLIYNTPLSVTGIRPLHLDLSNALKYDAAETLTGGTVTVTSSDVSLVTVSGDGPSTGTLTNDDSTTVAAGLAAIWTVTSVKASTSRVLLRVAWVTATGNTADTDEIELNLEQYVTE